MGLGLVLVLGLRLGLWGTESAIAVGRQGGRDGPFLLQEPLLLPLLLRQLTELHEDRQTPGPREEAVAGAGLLAVTVVLLVAFLTLSAQDLRVILAQAGVDEMRPEGVQGTVVAAGVNLVGEGRRDEIQLIGVR
jgi:hypothetical protein